MTRRASKQRWMNRRIKRFVAQTYLETSFIGLHKYIIVGKFNTYSLSSKRKCTTWEDNLGGYGKEIQSAENR
jgi:hypothetical protein